MAKEHAQLIAGRYTTTRRAHTSFLSLLNFLGEIPVVANPDGTVSGCDVKGTQ